ncbi:MAG: hypothetical protein ACLT90_06195, partial [Enterococcus raffinosus]
SSFFPVFFVPAGDYKIKDFKKKGESQIYHFPPKFAGLKRRMRLLGCQPANLRVQMQICRLTGPNKIEKNKKFIPVCNGSER